MVAVCVAGDIFVIDINTRLNVHATSSPPLSRYGRTWLGNHHRCGHNCGCRCCCNSLQPLHVSWQLLVPPYPEWWIRAIGNAGTDMILWIMQVLRLYIPAYTVSLQLHTFTPLPPHLNDIDGDGMIGVVRVRVFGYVWSYVLSWWISYVVDM